MVIQHGVVSEAKAMPVAAGGEGVAQRGVLSLAAQTGQPPQQLHRHMRRESRRQQRAWPVADQGLLALGHSASTGTATAVLSER